MRLKYDQSMAFETLKTLDAYRASQRTMEEAYELNLNLPDGLPYLVAKVDGTSSIAVPVGRDWLQAYDRQSQRTALKMVATSTFHRAGTDYIQVTLSDQKLLRTFGDFVDNLLEALERCGTEDPGAVTVRLLSESRQLFCAAGTAVPGNEAQVGLLLELETLRALYDTVGTDALRRWTGPDNERHDFELEEASLECKATLSRENLAVTIHGAHQLDSMGDKPLVLLVRKYERTLDGGTSLPDMIREIAELPGINTDELARRLAEAGLSPEILEKDAEFARYLRVETHEFNVDASFPHIPTKGLSDRINQVAYTVDLREPSSLPGYRSEPQILENN